MHVPQPTKIDSDIMIKSIFYRAPEVFKQKYGKEMDWWAVGVIIFELMFGNVPFFSKQGLNKMEKKIIAAKVIFPNRAKYPELQYSDDVEDLIRSLLVKDQKSRLGSKGDYQ